MRVLFLTALLAATPGLAVAQQAAPDDPGRRVTRLATEGDGSVNAYIIDAGAAVAAVDSQRTLNEGRAIAAQLKATGKAVVGVLVTHPHPDHVGGLAALVDATQAPVFGSSDTAVELGADTRKLIALAHAMDPEHTAAVPPAPDTIVKDGETVRVGDLDVAVIEFGPSEASNTTVYVVPELNAAFVGDLLNPGMTPFLLEKRTKAWLAQLDALEQALPADTIAYPGHGAPGPLGELVAQQRQWLTDLAAPRIPIYSTRTGRRLLDAEAVDPEFLAGQVAAPVLFWDALDALLNDQDVLLVETGPGRALTMTARSHPRVAAGHSDAVATLPARTGKPGAELRALLGARGRIWLEGHALPMTT